MASPANQGLQIALIACAFLVVILGFGTFWFYKTTGEETLKALSAVKNEKAANETLAKTVGEMTQLKQLMGYAVRDEVGTISANFKKDVEAYAATMRESEQNYRNIVSQLAAELQKQSELVVDAQARNDQMLADFKAKEQANATEVEQYKTGLKQAKDDLEQERTKFTADRDKFKEDDAKLVRKLDDTKKDLDEKFAKNSKDLEETEGALRKTKQTLDAVLGSREDQDLSTEIVDGKITWVNQRGHLVWLNLGSDDGLRRQTSFEVIGSEETNPVKAVKKGTVEVIRIIEGHLAEARIIDDDPSKPLMPGDLLFSVAWRPGHAEHFALVGLMDLDKDGTSDLDKVKDLITVNGGIVDAELRDDGKRVGQMTVGTRYLVMGEKPTEKSKSSEYLDNYSKMIGESKSLPIKTISLRDLTGYLGYKDTERTIPLGPNANPNDFRPRAPSDVPRRSNNDSFKKSRNTPSGKNDTVY